MSTYHITFDLSFGDNYFKGHTDYKRNDFILSTNNNHYSTNYPDDLKYIHELIYYTLEYTLNYSSDNIIKELDINLKISIIDQESKKELSFIAKINDAKKYINLEYEGNLYDKYFINMIDSLLLAIRQCKNDPDIKYYIS